MIIDSHPVVRLGIKRLLEPSWEFEELPDGRGAVDLLNSVGNFEVAIVEMRAAGNKAPSGTTTIRDLLRQQPGLGIVAHGGGGDRHAIKAALDAGASAYVSKRSSPATMRSAIDEVLRFNSFIDPDVERNHDERPRVTPRQRQILQMFADGHSTDEAAKLQCCAQGRLDRDAALHGCRRRASTPSKLDMGLPECACRYG